jgi:hypothetical protein
LHLLGFDLGADGYNTKGVRVSTATSPALDSDNHVLLAQYTELHGLLHTPLETAVDIFLPDLDVEVGLRLREMEGVHATVEMGVLIECVSGWVTVEGGNRKVHLREQHSHSS